MKKSPNLVIDNFFYTEVKFRLTWGASNSVGYFQSALYTLAVKCRKNGVKVLIGGGTMVGQICISHPARHKVEATAKKFIRLLRLYDAEDNS